MLPQKIFKIRIFNLAENKVQTTKFRDFWNSVANSLNFKGLFQIPGLFQVFQVFEVSGNPDMGEKLFGEHRKGGGGGGGGQILPWDQIWHSGMIELCIFYPKAKVVILFIFANENVQKFKPLKIVIFKLITRKFAMWRF